MSHVYPQRSVHVLYEVMERLRDFEWLSAAVQLALAQELIHRLSPSDYIKFLTLGTGAYEHRIEEYIHFEAYVFGAIARNAEDIETLITGLSHTRPKSAMEEVFVEKIKNEVRSNPSKLSLALIEENSEYLSSFNRCKDLLKDLL
ncbi:MAG: hypothetical protein UR73_C0032G0008 [candidate division WS6 bacterium GW2011_GWF1_35_23]|uniref:Uncharacterized protein n=1 Tax=candidate division WS6 bacterium GW2011_GWF1_35_23 TaxID=1619097 RepID=A0A0G0EJU2_9BACT|nr:MAG: hypothetical protein UR73_C0032G0008 [candidate division WS6 bacterium GW2011_GWF1_35_23]